MDGALQEFTFELMRHAAEQGLSRVTVTEGNFSITVENRVGEAAPTESVQQPVSEPEAAAEEYTGNVVTAPLVGTFYAANAPEEPPLVAVGDTVTKGQTLCVIEAMKTMNAIECPCDGTVQRILVENGALVEYHQPIIVIE